MKHGTMPFLSPPPNAFLCSASGIASSSLTATASVRHLPSYVKYDSNLHVGASALTFLFPLHQAETKTHDGWVTFSGDLRGFVHPPPTPDDIHHSPNCSPPPDIALRYGSVCAFVQLSHVPQNSVV